MASASSLDTYLIEEVFPVSERFFSRSRISSRVAESLKKTVSWGRVSKYEIKRIERIVRIEKTVIAKKVKPIIRAAESAWYGDLLTYFETVLIIYFFANVSSFIFSPVSFV